MGIASSTGVIYDFAGPYTIGVGKMAFGDPTRYIQLSDINCFSSHFDDAIEQGCEEYSKRMHNLCCDNCHSHVARCLDLMKYGRFNLWNMIILAFWMFFLGKFTSFCGMVKQFLPFAIVISVIFIIKSFS